MISYDHVTSVLIETLWNVKLVVGKIIGNEIRY